MTFAASSKLADAGHKVAVALLLGGTGFLCYTAVNQALFLTERRKRLNAEYERLKAEGNLPEGTPEKYR
eukprot:CAMPEP_0204830050 /NCGR_PEP_ID=MMETSP1346-20131115/8304_1 /ASSEMBLY_ACC=CAM_ASM_000771 /TAXON_ID=215587 /ORGANISM="Aplanochytrium stocchinoi, Strain GSBS06" /LENGTH=68 /DNA_ID=CAMNT_0051960173 /DNA_START=72 /DNA_END=278 /DNA_ORIENTATION=+